MGIFQFSVSPDGYLHAKATGEVTLENIQQGHMALAERLREEQCSRVLIDARDISSRMTVTELFQMAQQRIGIALATPQRIAQGRCSNQDTHEPSVRRSYCSATKKEPGEYSPDSCLC